MNNKTDTQPPIVAALFLRKSYPPSYCLRRCAARFLLCAVLLSVNYCSAHAQDSCYKQFHDLVEQENAFRHLKVLGQHFPEDRDRVINEGCAIWFATQDGAMVGQKMNRETLAIIREKSYFSPFSDHDHLIDTLKARKKLLLAARELVGSGRCNSKLMFKGRGLLEDESGKTYSSEKLYSLLDDYTSVRMAAARSGFENVKGKRPEVDFDSIRLSLSERLADIGFKDIDSGESYKQSKDCDLMISVISKIIEVNDTKLSRDFVITFIIYTVE